MHTKIISGLLFISIIQGVFGMNISSVEGMLYNSNQYVRVEIQGGIIQNIIPLKKTESDIIIAPGLIDTQVNGYIGVSFSEESLTVEDVKKVTKALWKLGVTSYFPTIITSPKERTIKNVEIISKASEDPEIASCIPGIHLEGPFISSEDGYRGAHNKDWVLEPDLEFLKKVINASGSRIIQVTLAPELEGSMDLINYCVDKNIIVGLGHHNASSDVIQKAADAGAGLSVHLGNACSNMIHRHVNPLWPQLAEDRLFASIIADGFHLRPEELIVFYKAKTKDRLILISDMTELAGMPPGEYTWNNALVVVTDDRKIMLPEQNVLAGASLPLAHGISHLLSTVHCSLEESINMASKNPAGLFGLNDRGQIEKGKRADLVLMKIEDKIEIVKTIAGGKVVFCARE